MSGRGGGHRRGGGGGWRKEESSFGRGGEQAKGKPVDPDNPTLQLFASYRDELDAKHDKHERIVKLSRDVTIESKRVIFLLHRNQGESGSNGLEEAEQKVKSIQQSHLKRIAEELRNEDPYRFVRAFSPGLQEYIEAVSYLHYLKTGGLITQEEVQKDLVFSFDTSGCDGAQQQQETSTASKPADETERPPGDTDDVGKPQADANDVNKDGSADGNTGKSQDDVETSQMTSNDAGDVLTLVVSPTDYILGIADLTGELMRLAVNSVGHGDLEAPFSLRDFLQRLSMGFKMLDKTDRETRRKIKTLQSSLSKVENACYTIQVRGSEMPKHLLAEAFTSPAQHSAAVDDHDGI